MDVGTDFLVWAWNPVTNATGYEAHAFPDGTPPTERPPLQVTAEPIFRTEGLEPGTLVGIFVRAIRETAGGRAVGPWSDYGTATTAAPTLAVSFVDSALSVAEGDAAEIAVQYRALGLNAPVSLRVSVLPGTAEAEDYEVSPGALEIPAGTNPDGKGSLTLRALTDRFFAEGEEMLEVRLVPPAGIHAEMASGLGVTIEEAGANPCAGTVVHGHPPEVEERYDVVRTRLSLDFASGSEDVVFEWLGPYDGQAEPLDFVRKRMGRTSRFQVAILAWTTERMAGVIRHTFEFAWPTEASRGVEAGIRFRSNDGACTGEPMAVCTGASCELIP